MFSKIGAYPEEPVRRLEGYEYVDKIAYMVRDTPGYALHSSSRASVLEKSLPKNNYKYQLSIAAIFKDESFFLREWIEYHRLAGVEHFFLYNNSSIDQGMEILAPYIKQGIVEVFDWPTKNNIGDWQVDPKHFDKFDNRILFSIAQREAAHDALRRSCGVTKWLAVIDLDEFLVPLQDTTVTECLEKRFTQAAGVYIHWRTFGTSTITLNNQQSILLNLTSCSSPHANINKIGKSIVRPESVISRSIWCLFIDVHYFMINENSRYYNASARPISLKEKFKKGFDVDTHHEFSRNYDDKYLRLNHYKMGDDKYFYERRLEKIKVNSSQSLEALVQDYRVCNEEKDFAIVNYIKNKNVKKGKNSWNNGMFNRVG